MLTGGGIAALIYSLFKNYEVGVVRIIQMSVHLALDADNAENCWLSMQCLGAIGDNSESALSALEEASLSTNKLVRTTAEEPLAINAKAVKIPPASFETAGDGPQRPLYANPSSC